MTIAARLAHPRASVRVEAKRQARTLKALVRELATYNNKQNTKFRAHEYFRQHGEIFEG